MAKSEARRAVADADEAGLRDFIARAERDLAGGPDGLFGEGDGLTATFPEFRAGLERAVALARAELARIEARR